MTWEGGAYPAPAANPAITIRHATSIDRDHLAAIRARFCVVSLHPLTICLENPPIGNLLRPYAHVSGFCLSKNEKKE